MREAWGYEPRRDAFCCCGWMHSRLPSLKALNQVDTHKANASQNQEHVLDIAESVRQEEGH